MKMSFFLFVLLHLLSLSTGEDFQAFYLPEDKVARYPYHPKFEKNSDIYYGFTLKENIFSAMEREEVINLRNLICNQAI